MHNYVVVVLGDIGRSPRMQNHCVCLSKLPEAQVHIVGYTDTKLFDDLSADNVHIHRIRPFWEMPRYLFPIYAPLKIFWLFLQLFMLLFKLPKFEMILMQNPPSMPTMVFCWLISKIKGGKFVIDWHNLGYSLLKVHKTNKHIVKIAEVLELYFGKFSDGNITVTNALKEFLAEKGIETAVVYDRPSNLFKHCPEERDNFASELGICKDDFWLITSTSWTPDEEIQILLEMADVIDKKLDNSSRGLSIIITGKGPDRRAFEAEVKGRNYRNVSFYFEFLKYEEYAKLLGCCDAGVSLHKSSSGIDLPMKGLDMIGAGLPLLSVNYQCIGELVKEGENGLLFNDGKELSDILIKLFVTKEISLEKLQQGSLKDSEEKWEKVWNTNAKPVFFKN